MGYSFTPLIRLIVLQGHATGRVGGLGLSQLLCQLIDLLTTLSRLAAPGIGSLGSIFTKIRQSLLFSLAPGLRPLVRPLALLILLLLRLLLLFLCHLVHVRKN
jgi:hypothetical protein